MAQHQVYEAMKAQQGTLFTQEELVKKSGFSKSTISKALFALRNCGVKSSKKGRRQFYALPKPDRAPQAQPVSTMVQIIDDIIGKLQDLRAHAQAQDKKNEHIATALALVNEVVSPQ
jgi:biotin operon repressor